MDVRQIYGVQKERYVSVLFEEIWTITSDAALGERTIWLSEIECYDFDNLWTFWQELSFVKSWDNL